MTYLAILGRLPAISLAELESRFGADKVIAIDHIAALIEAEDVDLERLGGTVKLAQLETKLESFTRDSVLSFLADQTNSLADGKLNVGLSYYGRTMRAKQVLAEALELKKRLRQAGRSVRIIPNQQPALNTAQVYHNSLLTKGAEWLVVQEGDGCLIGKTIAVQDVEAYGRRDYGRPERSAKVGMLPPKLAQIMLNLAAPPVGSIVLDPFCGTGVVLQEAALMSYQPYGSDIDPQLVEMSRRNLNAQKVGAWFETGDATNHKWEQPIAAVVTEGYLGPALTKSPPKDEVAKLKSEAAQLTIAFLANLAAQTDAGTPVIMTLPAWLQHGRYARLDVLDQITDLGYTHLQFKHAGQDDLLYYREGQIVARELIVLRRN